MISKRSSGILLHPTSLPGPHGGGDFGADAYRFVDWLATAGQTLWQVLPLGEVGSGNSPYMSSSAFAGNVLLINLAELAEHGWLTPKDLVPDPAFKARRIDYTRLHPFRLERLHRAARRFFAKKHPLHEEFSAFCLAEKAWLDDYALFMAIDLHKGGRRWSEWPLDLARRAPDALRRAGEQHIDEVEFWKFCQWNFARQWARLKRYANDKGIQIVGDMPIFVAYQSSDVWANQELFELDAHGNPAVIAGVPPDYFSATGQLWGNPLYRWSTHEKTGFGWWIARLRQALKQADLVRIDHFRGFAAYWETPASESTAVNGRWVTAPGEKLFTALKSTLGELPIIAEDLGMITQDVTDLREKFGLPGMRVLHFAFSEIAEHLFLPHNYEPNTVAYTGTHDNDTSIGWWAKANARERAFTQLYLGTDGHAIQWDLIRALSVSVAERVVYPMQDVLELGNEHRMNLPGKKTGNWEWRFDWQQLQPWHAKLLAEMGAVHGRCTLSHARLPD